MQRPFLTLSAACCIFRMCPGTRFGVSQISWVSIRIKEPYEESEG